MDGPRLALHGRAIAPGEASEALETLAAELDRLFGNELLTPFRASRRDVDGCAGVGADPLAAVIHSALRPGPLRMSWLIEYELANEDAANSGVAAERGDRTTIRTGDPGADGLLADLMPTLVDQLEGLTERQRTIARLALVDELRQSEVASLLGVRRATVSISFERAHIASLRRLLQAMRRVARAGMASAGDVAGR